MVEPPFTPVHLLAPQFIVNFAPHKLTHTLLLVAALLSPLQALQGTHLLCWLMGDRQVATANDAQVVANVEHCGCGYCAAPVEGEVVRDDAANHSPCDCPTDCFCRRAGQPLLTSVAEELIQPSTAIAYTPIAVAAANYGVDVPNVDHRVGGSALEHCIALCRFTV